MLHILHGPDSFSRGRAFAQLKQGLDTDGMLASNTNVLEAKSLAYQQLVMVADALPFLAAARLVVVEGLLARFGGRASGRRRGTSAAALPEEWRALPEYIPRMPPSTTLVLLDGDVPAESPLLTSLA